MGAFGAATGEVGLVGVFAGAAVCADGTLTGALGAAIGVVGIATGPFIGAAV